MTTLSEYPRVKSPEKLDAARTLLEASRFRSGFHEPLQTRDESSSNSVNSNTIHHGFTSFGGSWDNVFSSPKNKSAGALDALAALASTERRLNVQSSSDEDSESMPPPLPRRQGRMRSVSNPEGMEKWDSFDYHLHSSDKHYFVLPRSILEQELASVKLACRGKESAKGISTLSTTKTIRNGKSISMNEPVNDIIGSSSIKLDLNEILKQARSRLSEEMAESISIAEKGDVLLPHLLEKYKESYNKNGRIGIYTPDERAAIIAKFHRKRSRRVWNKKIRYNCRKNLADQRQRVKGRFVKRTDVEGGQDDPFMVLAPSSSLTTLGCLATVQEDSLDSEEDMASMPNVMDDDAEFIPTREQPYRRVRRYTIT